MTKKFFTLFFVIGFSASVFAQYDVEFGFLRSGDTLTAVMIPSFSSTRTVCGTAQFTFLAPTGTMYTNIDNTIDYGTWDLVTTFLPANLNNFYTGGSFTEDMVAVGITNVAFNIPVTAGVPVRLFSFVPTNIIGDIRILTNGEPIQQAVLNVLSANFDNSIDVDPDGSGPMTPLLAEERYVGNAPSAVQSFPTLPIECVSFEAVATQNTINLAWTSIVETPNTVFEVLRSKDGINWEKVGSVAAGEPDAVLSYTFVDSENLMRGTTYYYQLRALEISGESTNLCDVVSANLSGKTSDFAVTGIQPNPTQSELNVTVETSQAMEGARVVVYDEIGRAVVVLSTDLNVGVNTIRLNLSELPAAVYFLTINGFNGEQIVQPVVKQ